MSCQFALQLYTKWILEQEIMIVTFFVRQKNLIRKIRWNFVTDSFENEEQNKETKMPNGIQVIFATRQIIKPKIMKTNYSEYSEKHLEWCFFSQRANKKKKSSRFHHIAKISCIEISFAKKTFAQMDM